MGVLAGLAVLGHSRWRHKAKFNAAHAERVSRWRALPRSEQRKVKAAVRGRGPVPPEYASVLEEQITAVQELWQAQNVQRVRGFVTSAGQAVVICLVGVLLAFVGRPDRIETVLGFAAIAYGVTFGIAIAATLVQNRRWARRWPARMLALRAEIEAMNMPDTASK